MNGWDKAYDIVVTANNNVMVKILKDDIKEHCLKCERSMTMLIKKLMYIVPIGCKRCSLYKYKRIRESMDFHKDEQEFLS